jgi:hypothetical protein
MLRMTGESGSAAVVQERIAAIDRARTFVTLLVVLHHSVLNFTYFGHGDSQRWLGFDLVVLFNDSFFMALMFFISGLFVWDGLTRKGWAVFLRDRAWRLGVPFLVSIFLLMPIAYYRRTLAKRPRLVPVGPARARHGGRPGLVLRARCRQDPEPHGVRPARQADNGLRHFSGNHDRGL